MPQGVPAEWCSVYRPTVGGIPENYFIAAKNVNLGGGKRRKIRGRGATEREARARLAVNYAKYLREGEEGRPIRKVSTPASPSFEKRFYAWHDGIDVTSVSDVVRHKYLRAGQLHILPEFGHMPIASITRDDIKKFLNTTLPEKKNSKGGQLLSPSGRANVFKVLHQVLMDAFAQNLIATDPTFKIKRPKHEPKDEPVTMRAGQMSTLMRHLERDNHPDRARFLFQLLGLRQGERLGLEWSCISGLNKSSGMVTVRIKQQLHGGVKGAGYSLKPSTKTESSKRKLPIPEPWLSALRAYKAQQDEWKKSPDWSPLPQFADMVFLRKNGKLITTNNDTADWHKLLADYGYPDFRGHLNRHITASLLAQQNPPVKIDIVRQILGHGSAAMTWYYTATSTKEMVAPLEVYGEGLTLKK
jgi:integrase